MIRKLINEWDNLSDVRHTELGADLRNAPHIDYGRDNADGPLNLYAYLFGKVPLGNGEIHSLRFIYVSGEKGGRTKMFLRGVLNSRISGGELDLIKKQVVVDVMSYFRKYCHKGFGPLMKYCLDMDLGLTRNDYIDALRDTGFNVPGNLFRNGNRVLSCLNNESKIRVLPNGQLMTIIDRDGELTMYLADCHVAHSPNSLLEQPPMDESDKEYADVLFCNLDVLVDDWNDYVRTL